MLDIPDKPERPALSFLEAEMGGTSAGTGGEKVMWYAGMVMCYCLNHNAQYSMCWRYHAKPTWLYLKGT
jgi:hypothetical protein